MSWNGHFELPEYGYDDFARHMYYAHLAELEAFGLELDYESFEEYNKRCGDFIMEKYERFLSE